MNDYSDLWTITLTLNIYYEYITNNGKKPHWYNVYCDNIFLLLIFKREACTKNVLRHVTESITKPRSFVKALHMMNQTNECT